jgi:hypothetical protein
VIGNVPEWNNQRVHIFVEDNAVLFENVIRFVSGRQQFFNILEG